eukprot:9503850-Pyramimonas_sp.AAC.2
MECSRLRPRPRHRNRSVWPGYINSSNPLSVYQPNNLVDIRGDPLWTPCGPPMDPLIMQILPGTPPVAEARRK